MTSGGVSHFSTRAVLRPKACPRGSRSVASREGGCGLSPRALQPFRERFAGARTVPVRSAAENILGGHWPNDLHFAKIIQRFGRDVLDAVFGPDIDATLARLTAEARDLEQQLQDIQAKARQVQGFTPQPDLFDATPAPLDRQEALRRLTDGGAQ